MKTPARRGALALALPAALLAAGCILPVSTGAPMPATTLGRGKIGIAVSGEAPVLDLLADSTDDPDGEDFDNLHGAAPAGATTMTASIGIGDSTDLEISAEGALYFFLFPLPTGGSIGVRQHVKAADLFDFAFAARLGGVASDFGSGSSDDTSASAVFGAFQGIVQLRNGFFRPLLSVNLMPFRIKRDPSDQEAFSFGGLASSATFGLMLVGSHVQIGPYFTVTNFESERFGGGWFGSGGLMLAVRPDRNRPSAPPPPPYPPGPAPYPPGPAPYPPPPGTAPYPPPPGTAPYPYPPGPGPAPYPSQPPGPGPAPYPSQPPGPGPAPYPSPPPAAAPPAATTPPPAAAR